MEEYACVNCGWKYDKDDFKQIDESFKCPKCGTEKRKFMTLRRLEDNQDVKVIEAHYDRMGEWKMDPKGFFTIKIFPEEGLIKVRYYKTIRKIECLIEGKTAMDIFNTIIREGFVSSLQHAADLGSELQKAEIALKLGKEYVQDSPLNL